MTEKKKSENVLVYIPPGAKINVENKDGEAPKPEYNSRVKFFDLEKVKQIVGGRYGRLAKIFRDRTS